MTKLFLFLSLFLALATSDSIFGLLRKAIDEAEEEVSHGGYCAGGGCGGSGAFDWLTDLFKSRTGPKVYASKFYKSKACPRGKILSVQECKDWAKQNEKTWERKLGRSWFPHGCVVSRDTDKYVYFNSPGNGGTQDDRMYLVCKSYV